MPGRRHDRTGEGRQAIRLRRRRRGRCGACAPDPRADVPPRRARRAGRRRRKLQARDQPPAGRVLAGPRAGALPRRPSQARSGPPEARSRVGPLQPNRARVMYILADTAGAPAMLKNRGPAIAAALGGKDNPNPTVTVDTLKKDLAEMVAEATTLGYDPLVTSGALKAFERASKAGLGAKDCTSLPVAWLARKT